MDKQTLSNYGWVVIAVLVLSVMIALATPFGKFVGDAVWNTMESLVEVSDKGMSVAIDKAGNVEDGSGNETQTPDAGEQGGTETPTGVQMLDTTDEIDKGVENIEVLTFRSSAPVNTLVEVKVDNEVVADTNYTVTEGSTIITFTEEFSKQLAVGTHTIDIVSEEGTASADFDVENSAGLYDANGNQLANWDELVELGFDTTNTDAFDITTLSDIISANNELSSATKLVISPTMTSIGDSLFSYLENITSIEMPNTITSIGEYAFNGCSALRTVKMPNNVSSIGIYAFGACENLTSIELPNSITTLGHHAFYNCSSLTSIELGTGITSIKNSTFSGCTSLASITISDKVTTIENLAFSGCTSLTTIYMPQNVTTIGALSYLYSPFYNCSSALKIYCGASAKQSGWSSYWNYYDNANTLSVEYNVTRADYINMISQ